MLHGSVECNLKVKQEITTLRAQLETLMLGKKKLEPSLDNLNGSYIAFMAHSLAQIFFLLVFETDCPKNGLHYGHSYTSFY